MTRTSLKSGHRPGASQPNSGLDGLGGPAWMGRGQCARRHSKGASKGKLIHDPDLWHPTGETGHTNLKNSAEAIRICRQCPVAWQCLKHAIQHNEPGIWGGMTEQQRGILRARWEGQAR